MSPTAIVRRLSASSLYGAPPGSMVATNQLSDPVAPPARNRGSRPARTALDLPVPDAPTSSTSRLLSPEPDNRAVTSSISAARPK